MTDCDVDPGLALLRDSIYGGPALPTALLAASLRRLGLECPFAVVAVQPAGRDIPLPGKEMRVLDLHGGLAYWCLPGDPAPALAHLDRLGVLHGGVQRCAAVDGLLTAIREAVVDLRRHELAARLAARVDVGSEARLRAEALKRLAAGDPAWRDTLRRWLVVVTVRHLRSLNNLRRKLVEFATQLTRAHDDRDLAFVFWRAIARIYHEHSYSGLEALFPEVIDTLAQRIAQTKAKVGDLRQARSPTVQAAAACVRERFCEPISLEDVAAAAGVSAAHLARSWRKEIGCSVGDTLRDLRLAEAQRLLAEGRRTVLDVALRCGFGSVEHFHRTFRARLGISPDAWRRDAADGGDSA